MTPRPSSPSWPLTGRDDLVGAVTATLSAAGPDSPRAIVLTGPTGIGKTRIARAVSRARVSAGATCVWISGGPHTTGVPFGAIRHLMPAAAAWVTEPGTPMDPAVAARRVMSAGGPDGLVVLDDLDLIDAATRDLAVSLVTDRAVRVLATAQAVGAPAAESAAAALVAGLGSAATVQKVPPLGTAAVADLLRRALGGEVTAETAAALASASRGNPRELGDLVSRSLAQGTLEPLGSLWEWRGDAGPSTVNLTEWLGLVSADVKRVLEVVAIADGTAGPEIVSSAAARVAAERTDDGVEVPAADVAAATAALEEAHLLGMVRTVVSGQRRVVVLSHRETPQLLRDGMGDLGARRTALALAQEVERFGGRRAIDVLRTSRWRLDATGTAPRAQLISACRVAARTGDVESLERVAWTVLREAPDPMAAVLLADALIGHGRFAEGAGLLDSADGQTDDAEITVGIALARATLTGMARSQHAEAAQALADAEARIGDAGLRATLRSARLFHELWRGGPVAALRVVEPGPDGEPVVNGEGTTGDPGAQTLALALAGRTADALHLGTGWAHTSTLACLAVSLAASDDGQLERAATVADDGYSEAAWGGVVASRMWLALAAGRAALRRGQPVTANRWYEDAAVLADDCGLPGGARAAAVGRALAALWFPEANSLAAVKEAPTPVDPRAGLLLTAEPVLARAAWLHHQGDTDGALMALEWGYRLAVARGAVPDAAWIAYSHLRLGRPDLAATGLEALRERLSATLLAAWADHARAAVLGDPEALAAAGEAMAGAGAWFDAAAATEGAMRLVGQDDPRAADWFVNAATWQAKCEGATDLNATTGV